jgi:hypothetical protein
VSTIAVIGTLAEDACTRIVAGTDVVELRVVEVTNGIDDAGTAWTDDQPLTWTVYVRGEQNVLAARLQQHQEVRVDGRVRNLWGRIAIDDATVSLPLVEIPTTEARAY